MTVKPAVVAAIIAERRAYREHKIANERQTRIAVQQLLDEHARLIAVATDAPAQREVLRNWKRSWLMLSQK